MPAKNTLKQYVKQGHYHIYNRGVDKRTIFTNEQDHKVFLSYLKEYLSPPPDPSQNKTVFNIKSREGKTFTGVSYQRKNYHQEIELICYCLMPNHFHFLIRQQSKKSIEKFMRSLITRYSKYFNQRHQRTGSLFESRYKAVLIQDDPYLLHLSRYIHLNPQEIHHNLAEAHSSYSDYVGATNTSWINPKPILDFFTKPDFPLSKNYTTYQQFVESTCEDSSNFLGELTLKQ